MADTGPTTDAGTASPSADALIVRARTDTDLDATVAMAWEVYELDGYPARLPDDLAAFLAAPDAYGAWVAEHGSAVVGHVALHPHGPASAFASTELETPVDRLGVVARLLVSPSARRLGVGRRLLDHASREAMARGLWPILDVAAHYEGAIRLYEACGWRRAGEITYRFDDGGLLDELVFVGPRPPQQISVESR
jgi:ribosomal protein S18 acetylase RimI-like enzyme